MTPAADNDWRLQGQEKYLKGATLFFRPYRKPRPTEHDHCEFCSAKFMEAAPPGDLTEGYASQDEHRWICPRCFEDFKDRFGWKMVSAAADDEWRLKVAELIAQLHGSRAEDALRALTLSLPESFSAVAAAYRRERNPERRAALIHCLWQYRHHATMATLGSALGDPDARVWKEALDGLVTLGGDEAERVLRETRATLPQGEAGTKGAWFDEAIQQIGDSKRHG